MKKGTKVRVLANNKVGTVADSTFFVLGCRKHIRVAVKFDDMPEAVWYKKEELGRPEVHVKITFAHENGEELYLDYKRNYMPGGRDSVEMTCNQENLMECKGPHVVLSKVLLRALGLIN